MYFSAKKYFKKQLQLYFQTDKYIPRIIGRTEDNIPIHQEIGFKQIKKNLKKNNRESGAFSRDSN